MTMSKPAAQPRFDHTALFYCAQDEYLGAVVPFISEGVRAKQPVWVAIPEPRMAFLRRALGDTANGATLVDITEMGRNPGRILAAELAFVERHPNRPVRMIAEPLWPGRTKAEYCACIQHEALTNLAFGEREVAGLCLYDAALLDDDENGVLADVRATHPLIRRAGSQEPSTGFAVDAALERCNQALARSPAAVTYTVSVARELAGARRHGTRYGRLLGLSADRIADLQLIITELATNSIQHGGDACRLAFWEDDGHLVCEARDNGFIADPLAGRRPPSSDRPSPAGLFVVNAIADLVRIHTTPAGTTIHAYLRIDRRAGEDM